MLRHEIFRQLGEQRWKDFENGVPEYQPSFPEKPADKVPEGLDPVNSDFAPPDFDGYRRKCTFKVLQRGCVPGCRGTERAFCCAGRNSY